MAWMVAIWVAAQDERIHGAARTPIEACVGPHWQATSEGAQPAAVMAEERQAVAQAGSALRFWAVARERIVVRARTWYFILMICFVD